MPKPQWVPPVKATSMSTSSLKQATKPKPNVAPTREKVQPELDHEYAERTQMTGNLINLIYCLY